MRRSAIKRCTRKDDERHLQWLQWRCMGFTSRAIGAAHGYSNEHVRTATNRIREADICQSGEDEQIVKGAYW